MALTKDRLRDRLIPGSRHASEPADAFLSALQDYLESGEEIQYSLPGKGDLIREVDGEVHTYTKPPDGQSIAIVTDRQLLFALAGPDERTVIEIPYTNVKSVDADDGLLRSRLTVAVWGEGEYRYKIADSSDLGAAVHYLQAASDCWQRVVSALEDASEQIDLMGEELERGALDHAQEARDQIREKVERAHRYLEQAAIDPPSPLCERIERVERKRDRAEIRNRLTRAETLMTEATHQADAREYTAAYQSYWYARDHLETAQMIARNAEVSEPAAVSTKLEEIETRLRHLEVRPLALARQACERAVGTDKLDVEVDAWEQAFEHYRDALTAGWGTDLAFEGETSDIRFRIEVVVANLIEGLQELGDRCEAAGDQLRSSDVAGAIEQYEGAIEHLERARWFAAQFRAGDREALDDQIDALQAKRLELRQP